MKKNNLTIQNLSVIISLAIADVAHLVERHLAKVEVASSSLVIRSRKSRASGFLFFCLVFRLFSDKCPKTHIESGKENKVI